MEFPSFDHSGLQRLATPPEKSTPVPPAIDTNSNGISDRANAQIEKRAKEFEALFLSQMLKPVFESAGASTLFGGETPESEAFGTLLHDEYAKAIANNGGVGLADHIKASLIALQSEN